ncbi:LysM peptidoglycan-binding domain-containing protein [Paenibacillus validus]|uniref:M23 family metallopeptidase n=1 Tax=Paenibacillus TaxID=44249 RepID=UPI000FD7255E|nr:MULTISPECIES: M23 family metallopeptidase [Paenibacillus]MED4602805.1 LysM peptidoglycan-binding domain-containing protein [Paenibacillus validus]MED4607353.1 LysM peptidoglycan-binding domain-containing protein [Paenibacillus validus]
MRKKITFLLMSTVASMSIALTAHASAYTVKPGDSLWKIAAANKTTVDQIVKTNGLSSTSIYPGQVLQLPDDPNTYIIQNGDTFWKIAARYGISTLTLIQANPQIADPNNIWPGLAIHIPQKPAAYLEGIFPLRAGTYEPFTNNYADSRTWSPDGTETRTHEGVDIMAKKGTPVYSVMDGTIVNIGWNEYGGWRISVKVDDNTQFYYAHLSGYADGMKKGATVRKGQLLGYVGNTGYGPVGTEGKFDPHLHFGIYTINPWQPVDPYTYLKWWQLNGK